MSVHKYRKRPVDIEAIQFTGSNLDEVQRFCGFHRDSGDETDICTFNKIGTYLVTTDDEATAELWVDANKSWLPITPGEYILHDALGFYPCKQEIFEDSYSRIEENSDFPVIGPECFTNREETVISYKGANYYKACDYLVSEDTSVGRQYHCVKRVNHPGRDHESYHGVVVREPSNKEIL